MRSYAEVECDFEAVVETLNKLKEEHEFDLNFQVIAVVPFSRIIRSVSGGFESKKEKQLTKIIHTYTKKG